MSIPVLVVDTEPKSAREERHRNGRPTACESFITTLEKIDPSLQCVRAAPVDADRCIPENLPSYRAAFFSGSPLHFYEEKPEVKRSLDFARGLFQTGIPCFGSCAGLQIAVMVAGGKVAAKEGPTELGIARGIVPTEPGGKHPLLQSRLPAFAATSIHGDEVVDLPPRSVLLATSAKTRVQAAELHLGQSTFWGVQYHPEISLREAAMALRDDAQSVIEKRFARGSADLETHLGRLEALDNDPGRQDLCWQLGIDKELTDFEKRTVEIRNFIQTMVVRP